VPVVTPEPAPPAEPVPPARSAQCAALWTEADQYAERATAAHTLAAAAAEVARAAEAEHATAARAAQQAKEAHEAVLRETAEVATGLSRLEKLGPQIVSDRVQQETSHAAFLAFRRGDITADQLREVFKRAEGWTPEHDRLTKRTADLRTEEAATARARIEAERAVPAAAERARTDRLTANSLEATARESDNIARLRRTAAEECEQRHRR
jgi:chromosome segregation protein